MSGFSLDAEILELIGKAESGDTAAAMEIAKWFAEVAVDGRAPVSAMLKYIGRCVFSAIDGNSNPFSLPPPGNPSHRPKAGRDYRVAMAVVENMELGEDGNPVSGARVRAIDKVATQESLAPDTVAKYYDRHSWDAIAEFINR